MDQAVFIVMNVLIGVAALRWSDILLAQRSCLHRFVGLLGIFAALVVMMLELLGSFGLLNPQSILSAAVVVAVLSYLVNVPDVERSCELSSSKRINLRAWPVIFSITALGVFGGHALAATCWSGTQFLWDDFSYHATTVAHWYNAGSITLAPFSYQAYYPLNAELFTLWFAMPFGADVWCSLAGLYWMVLAAVSVAALVYSIGGRASAILAAAMVCASYVVMQAAFSFTGNDIAGPAVFVAALALLVHENPTKRSSPSVQCMLAAGLLAGVAIGCKVSFLPPTVILVLWLLWLSIRSKTLQPQVIIVFCLGVCVTGAYWYVRNWAMAGNPVFPGECGPLAGPMHAEAQAHTKLITWITHERESLSRWIQWLMVMTWWPTGLFVVAVVGLMTATAQRRSRETGVGLLVLLAWVILFVFPFLPFSGTDDSPTSVLKPYPRYLIATWLISVVLFAVRCDRAGRYRSVFWALAMLALFSARPMLNMLPGFMRVGHAGPSLSAEAFYGGVAFLGGVTAWGLVWLLSILYRLRGHRWWLAGLTIGVMALMVRTTPGKQARTNDNIYDYGRAAQPVGQAWAEVEMLPVGSRIAWFGDSSYQYYPLFGRRWQHVPVRVTNDGQAWEPLHKTFEHDPQRVHWWSAWDRPMAPLDHLVDNLVAAQIDYVFVTKWAGECWPAQRDVLRATSQVSCVYEDSYSEFYRITP